MYNKDDFPCNKKLKSHMVHYIIINGERQILDEAVFLIDGSKLDRLLRRILVDSARKRLAVRLDSVLERAESRISKSGFRAAYAR
jgi:hypothetical protein